MLAEGFMALTHHTAKGNYTWLRNQLSSPIIEIVILHPGRAVHLHTFGHHDLPSLIQFLGYKAKLRALSVILSTGIDIICVKFSGRLILSRIVGNSRAQVSYVMGSGHYSSFGRWQRCLKLIVSAIIKFGWQKWHVG